MPHSKKLLKACQEQLEKDYPFSEYSYLFEQKISSGHYPDIQIRKDGKLVCVCEIGYTEAEKIKAYRDMRISDIRWYSKKADLVIKTGEYDKASEELKQESLRRIKEFEEESKKRIDLEEKGLAARLDQIVEWELQNYTALRIERELKERKDKITELTNRDFYFLILNWDCWFCDEDRCNGKLTPEEIERLGGAESIYFNETEYTCFYECEFNEDHETTEGPCTWDDDCGPHKNEFNELFRRYIEFYLEIDKQKKKQNSQ